MSNYISNPASYSSASDDDSDFEIVTAPKSKAGRKKSTPKQGSSTSRPTRGKGKVVREPRTNGRANTKGKRPLAAMEEDLFEDDELMPMVKPPVKRNYSKKTSVNFTSDEDEGRPVKVVREARKPAKKRPSPQHDTSDDDDDSVMDDVVKSSKKQKSQVSENADTFIDLSPKTSAFATLPTFSCFIGNGNWIKSSYWKDTPYFTIRNFVDKDGQIPGKGITLKFEYLDIVTNGLQKMRQHYAALKPK